MERAQRTEGAEDDLLRRARSGDRNAFDRLVERHLRAVWQVAWRLVRNADDAEDVAQETFLTAWRGIGEFRGDAAFATWLHRIATTRALNHLDRAAERMKRASRPIEGPDPDPAAERAAGPREPGPLARLGSELFARVLDETLEGTRVRVEDGAFSCEFRLGAPGVHQAANAELALACARRLGVVDDAVLARAAERAFASPGLPARVEIVSRAPWIVIDGAHTEASAQALAHVLERIPRRSAHLVVSISAGKALAAICSALAPLADRVTVTRAEPIRSITPAEVAEAMRAVSPGLDLRIVPNPHLALRAAREALGPDDLLVATGSFYLAGIARSILRE